MPQSLNKYATSLEDHRHVVHVLMSLRKIAYISYINLTKASAVLTL